MENFKSNLSSKLEFRLEYCWLPVPGRRENFTGLRVGTKPGVGHGLGHVLIPSTEMLLMKSVRVPT